VISLPLGRKWQAIEPTCELQAGAVDVERRSNLGQRLVPDWPAIDVRLVVAHDCAGAVAGQRLRGFGGLILARGSAAMRCLMEP
jgi:hypothetical protein